MAGVAERVKQQAQAQFQQMALQVIDKQDQDMDAFKLRVLNDLKKIASGETPLTSIKVSDSDYEIMPPKPQIERKNGNGNTPMIKDVREPVNA